MNIDDIKLALRITTDEFDTELTALASACVLDLGIAGVKVPSEYDDLVKLAIITYVKLHFGNPDNYERLKRSYDEQKAQLSMASGYTVWERTNG